jgi:flagellar biosynthesis/type III secretory pathway protein FliH
VHQRTERSHGRPSNIVRAAALEIACAVPTFEEDETAAKNEAAALAAAKDAQALHELLVALGRQVEELRGRRRQTIGDISGLSVELGVALAERLLGAEIAADRQRLDAIVQQALTRLPAARAITVRAHPDDIALLERQLDDHADLKACRDTMTLRADMDIARGQLRLDAGEFFVEWDTARTLAELRSTLLETTFTDK